MRGLRSTLVLLVITVSMGAYIYFVERHRAPSSAPEQKEQLFDFEANDLSSLRVTSEDGGVTTLERTDEMWRIATPVDTAADEATVSSIASTLASLEVRRVVEESPINFEPFGLDEPMLDLGFSLNEIDTTQHLLVGEETPTGTDRYAKLSDTDRVFLIASYLNSTFNKTTFDLRDKTILQFEEADLDRLDITTADKTIRFEKVANEWELAEPWRVRTDFSTVQSLIRSLNSGQMLSVEREEIDDLKTFGLAEPGYTVDARAGSATATLHIGDKTSDGAHYAQDISRPLVFTIDESLVSNLDRNPSEYRSKDLFQFSPFNANRLEIQRGTATTVFEKTDTQTEDGEESWQRVEPEPADVERAEMDDLLMKLSNLRAESFVTSRSDAGLEPENITVAIRVRFGDGNKEERVAIWKTGDEMFAVHGDEPGAAQIDPSVFDDAITALETAQTGH
jgi:hypothetical protein